MAAQPTVDHLVLASVDREVGMRWVADRLGVVPEPGGSHEGCGTWNALVGLGDNYLEVMSLDPAQRGRASRFADLVAGHETPALVTVAVARRGLEEPVAMSRLRPDGTRLSWQVQFTATPLFFIDWLDCPRPGGLPDGGRLTSLSITTPDPSQLVGLTGVEVAEGPWKVEAWVGSVSLTG
jgi:hypothetical protein